MKKNAVIFKRKNFCTVNEILDTKIENVLENKKKSKKKKRRK